MTRRSTGSARVSPTFVTDRSCSARRSFTCSAGGMSPISSRNRVPPCAAWNFPGRVAMAPVNAPFTWPKSSDSSSASGMAPQFTATNGPAARDDLLPGAGLARHEHADVRAGDLLDPPVHLAHRGARPDELAVLLRLDRL